MIEESLPIVKGLVHFFSKFNLAGSKMTYIKAIFEFKYQKALEKTAVLQRSQKR